MITQVTTQLFSEIYVDEKDLTFDDIDKILKDTDVDTAIKMCIRDRCREILEKLNRTKFNREKGLLRKLFSYFY